LRLRFFTPFGGPIFVKGTSNAFSSSSEWKRTSSFLFLLLMGAEIDFRGESGSLRLDLPGTAFAPDLLRYVFVGRLTLVDSSSVSVAVSRFVSRVSKMDSTSDTEVSISREVDWGLSLTVSGFGFLIFLRAGSSFNDTLEPD
jgi:hypothetical protein